MLLWTRLYIYKTYITTMSVVTFHMQILSRLQKVKIAKRPWNTIIYNPMLEWRIMRGNESTYFVDANIYTWDDNCWNEFTGYTFKVILSCMYIKQYKLLDPHVIDDVEWFHFSSRLIFYINVFTLQHTRINVF